MEKQPPGRDGHSSFLHGDKWIIFGGDRHHMPFNDTYVLDLKKVFADNENEWLYFYSLNTKFEQVRIEIKIRIIIEYFFINNMSLFYKS